MKVNKEVVMYGVGVATAAVVAVASFPKILKGLGYQKVAKDAVDIDEEELFGDEDFLEEDENA